MRALGLAFLLVASAASAQSPRREGSYRTPDGKSVAWQIDENHSLVWNGARYTPVGLAVEGNPTAINAANEAGIKDLLIDLPLAGDWNATIAAAEANGQRYIVRLASRASGAPGVAVDPAAYRIAGLAGPQHVDVALPGVSEALIVTALKRDGSLLGSKVVPVKNDRLVYDTKVNAGLEAVVLVYPRTSQLPMPDLWEGLDSHRDALLARLKSTRFGPGLRGIVDPLGSSASLPGRELYGVPTSPAFQLELAAVIENKYRTVEGAMAAWSLSSSGLTTYEGTGPQGAGVLRTTFSDLAKLVPLWSGTRGVSQVWNPANGKLYAGDSRKSQIWNDIDEAVARTAARRVARLCRSIRQVVDVPVVQEWSGWAGLTEASAPAFDGIAARAEGETGGELMDSAARAVSTAARWSTRGWLLATDVNVPSKDLAASVQDLAGVGMGAAFVRTAPGTLAPVAARRAESAPASYPLVPVFFPENAANPAAVQRLPGGGLWLPTPEDGNRLDFGDSFYAYRIAGPRGERLVLWAKTPGRYLLRTRFPEAPTFQTLDGSDCDPRKAKTGINVTLTQIPLVIDGAQDLLVPDLAVQETMAEFGRLVSYAENSRRVGTDDIYAFKDAVQGFDANPGGNFIAMRTQLRRYASLISSFSWVEAESSKDTTFSEVAPLPGASGNQALILRSLIPSDSGYTATYQVPVANRGDVELWVAARLPKEGRRDLQASIGGQTLVAGEAPVSAYGAGFAWYRLGTTQLTGGVAKVTLRMNRVVGGEAAIDTLVFAPVGWRPSGLAYPYGLIGR